MTWAEARHQQHDQDISDSVSQVLSGSLSKHGSLELQAPGKPVDFLDKILDITEGHEYQEITMWNCLPLQSCILLYYLQPNLKRFLDVQTF